MAITSDGLELLKAVEGTGPVSPQGKLLRYKDSAGKWTIGYGHLIRSFESFPADGITFEEADALLEKDLSWAEGAVRRLITVPLSAFQFDALVIFTYNIGSRAFMKSAVRKRVNSGDVLKVPHEMLRWIYAGGQPVKGLVNRRLACATHFMRGT